MIVLGFDPSLTNFGWALYDTAASKSGRCVDRGTFSTGSKELFVSRYITLRERVRSLMEERTWDKIGIEYPIFSDFYSEGMYALFMFCCEALYEAQADVVFLANTQTKSRVREYLSRPKKMKIGKRDMIEAARKDAGGGRWNGDMADAYWVAKVASRFWQLHEGEITQEDLTDVEKHQFLKTHTYTRGKKAGKTVRKGIMYREDDRFFLWSEMRDIDGEES